MKQFGSQDRPHEGALAADEKTGLVGLRRRPAMQDLRLVAEKHLQSLIRYWSEAFLGDDKIGRWGQNRCTL
jgi:hypothetical protein